MPRHNDFSSHIIFPLAKSAFPKGKTSSVDGKITFVGSRPSSVDSKRINVGILTSSFEGIAVSVRSNGTNVEEESQFRQGENRFR